MTGLSLLALVVAALVVVYAYAGYPACLIVLRWVRGHPAPQETWMDEWPEITITLPVHNEEATIRGTLDHVLRTDYPAARRHVLVISDASTDHTDEIVREYRGRGVALVRLSERAGKTAAENAARPHLRGEIVVNTDASARLRADALKSLVAVFRDPSVGVASGRDVSVAPAGDHVGVGETGYVGYEMWVRDLETAVASIVGASGCFYASRRAMYCEIVPSPLSRDFAAPLIAREKGYRAVSVPGAVCFVPRTSSLRHEYRRKVRTMARGLETLFYKRALLNPLRFTTFAWMLWSHKLIRWLVPWAGLVGTAALVGLGAGGRLWAAVLLGVELVVISAAVAGWLWPRPDRVPWMLSLSAYLVFGLLAGLEAWWKALRGELAPAWEPTRRPDLGWDPNVMTDALGYPRGAKARAERCD